MGQKKDKGAGENPTVFADVIRPRHRMPIGFSSNERVTLGFGSHSKAPGGALARDYAQERLLHDRDELFHVHGRRCQITSDAHSRKSPACRHMDAMIDIDAFGKGEYLETVEVWPAKTLLNTFTISRLYNCKGLEVQPTSANPEY